MLILYLIKKEFLQMNRNHFLKVLALVYPVAVMCVFPWVMRMDVKNVAVVVVDNDHSTLSQQLVHRIEASHYFVFKGQEASYTDALSAVEQCEADVIVEVPAHFERNKTRGEHPQILIAVNAVNGSKGMLGASYMNQIVTASVAPEGLLTTLSQRVSTLYLYNKHLDSKRLMIPSLFGILLMIICGALPALNIVAEKEAGTIEAINVTPVSKFTFIMAKLIPYWLLGILVMTICIVLTRFLYGYSCVGSLFWVYLLALLLSFCFSGLGLVISNYNDTMQQAMFVLWFFLLICLLMSGLLTPARSMPHWAYLTTYVNPVAYFIDGVRTIYVRGGGFMSILPQLLGLTLLSVFADTWAVLSYRKNR